MSGVQTLAVATNLAFVLAACVVIGIVGGAFLDARLGTSPILLIVGSVLGTVSGIYSMWKTTTYLMNRFQRNKRNSPER